MENNPKCFWHSENRSYVIDGESKCEGKIKDYIVNFKDNVGDLNRNLCPNAKRFYKHYWPFALIKETEPRDFTKIP